MDVSFKRLLKMNKPETQWAVLGCLASAVLGAQMPAFAVALSSVIAVFYEPVRLPACDRATVSVYYIHSCCVMQPPLPFACPT